MNTHHQAILKAIRNHSGKPTQQTFINTYLGTAHPRFPIDNPSMRLIAKSFLKENSLTEIEFIELTTSLIEGNSFTEKVMAGFLLDYAGKPFWNFDPAYFNQWLNHLQGWAEIDTLCTGKYSGVKILEQFSKWKKLLGQFSKSKSIEKRRASLALCCAPLRKQRHEELLQVVFQNCLQLQSEKDVLITKAISWVLRNATKHHRAEVEAFINQYHDSLPKIAVRETLIKLKTGRKTKPKNAS